MLMIKSYGNSKSQWVHEELEMLENAGIISRSVSPCSSPIVVLPKKDQPDKYLRNMCVWNTIL